MARLSPAERRGLVFALRANGATLAEVGRVLGVSGTRARQIEWSAIYRIERDADRRFPVDVAVTPEQWRERGTLTWIRWRLTTPEEDRRDAVFEARDAAARASGGGLWSPWFVRSAK